MFQTGFPPIIRSSKLHIQRQVFVRPLLLPDANLAIIALSQRYYQILFELTTQVYCGGWDMRQIRGRMLETLKMKRQVGRSRRGWEDINRLYVKEIRQEVWADCVWFLIGKGSRLL